MRPGSRNKRSGATLVISACHQQQRRRLTDAQQDYIRTSLFPAILRVLSISDACSAITGDHQELEVRVALPDESRFQLASTAVEAATGLAQVVPGVTPAGAAVSVTNIVGSQSISFTISVATS